MKIEPTRNNPTARKGSDALPLRIANAADVERAAVTGSAIQYTEVKATDRLAKALSGRFCYCPAFGWQQWTGTHWKDVSDDVVTETARLKHRSWYSQAMVNALIDGSKGSGKVPAIKRLLSKAGVSACVSLSRGVLHVEAEKFDAQHDLLNTQSGVVDLRTGVLTDHDPRLYMRQITAVEFKPGAKHSDWTAALKAIRPDTREYMQFRVGQSITGYQPEDDVVSFLKGGGENGKSTFIGGITTPLGSYYRQVSDKVLLADAKSHTTELTDLHGLRVAVIEELPEGRHINVVLLKKITGQEITARRIRSDTMTWTTTHTTFVTTNYQTQVAETDWGTWRRLERIVFPYTYVSKGKKSKSRRDQRPGDPGLRDRVRNDVAVQEAALAWMVEGSVKWFDNGRKMPEQPESVRDDTLDWRKSSDLVLRYWLEFLEPDPGSWVVKSAFTKHFNMWLKADGHVPWNSRTITERWSSHEVFKNARAEERPIRPKPGMSAPPDIGDIADVSDDGHGERVQPSSTVRAWLGFRYR